MADIAQFAGATVTELDEKLKEVRIPRANLGPCPVCGNDIVENRKGFSCWSREDPGCGFVIWKSKAGKTLPPAVARELIAKGRTEKAVTGFKGRSGRSFRARLALMQTEDGKWRVEFDEPWAREGAKPPEGEEPPPAEPARRSGRRAARPEAAGDAAQRGWRRREALRRPAGGCAGRGGARQFRPHARRADDRVPQRREALHHRDDDLAERRQRAGLDLLVHDRLDLRRQAGTLAVRPRDKQLVTPDHVRHLRGKGDIRVGVCGWEVQGRHHCLRDRIGGLKDGSGKRQGRNS